MAVNQHVFHVTKPPFPSADSGPSLGSPMGEPLVQCLNCMEQSLKTRVQPPGVLLHSYDLGESCNLSSAKQTQAAFLAGSRSRVGAPPPRIAGSSCYASARLGELEALVQDVVKASSWWERHGVDCAILALSVLALPAGFLCLRSEHVLVFAVGVTILGVCHYTLTVKGSHLATHGALTESKRWSKIWLLFFVEVCTAFTAEYAKYGHVKMHHAYTNVVGLGDSSTWRLPGLNRYVYMFLAPLMIPVITPLVAVERLRKVEGWTAVRTLGLMALGLYGHYWLLLNLSGFKSPSSALACMFLTRALLAHPYLHVNIFQHIGLPMFSRDHKPLRIHMMSLGVLNLPRLPVLDWAFGHSLISCHVEHHLFPRLSDNMCLKVKPVVSRFLHEKQLPYNEDSYLARLRLFLSRYEEFMVQAPPITELVGVQ
ncbi:fatty acid desaturase 6 [Tupaia chinensis]|uniref:fatty acid desaturase 6 n=1 Tax=Tupaia chinensis TaxID=246437 RepID=UPI0003C91919|nr:fatty acid desaturase 6 [Tupaia chinensis]